MRQFTKNEKRGLLTSLRSQRRCGWYVARACMKTENGNHEKAKLLVPQYTKEGLGNPLMFLTVGILIIQFAYYALKLWKELRITDPSVEPLPEFEKGLM